MVSLSCYSTIACAHAGIAQLVEQLIRNQQVVSSSLISSSRNGGLKRYLVEKPSIYKPPEAPECENSGASKFRHI